MDAFKKAFSTTIGKIAGCFGCLFLVIIGIAILAAIGSSASKSSSSNPTSVPAKSDNSTSTSAVQSTTHATTTVQTTPQVLLDLSGSGTKTTQKFTAGGDWDLNWSYDCTNFGSTGNFQVYVYQGDGTLSLNNAAINELGAKGTDVEHYHTGGTFYLEVNSECSWHITAKG